MQINFYFNNLSNNERDCTLNFSVEQIEDNEKSYFYLYNFEDLTQRSFHGNTPIV